MSCSQTFAGMAMDCSPSLGGIKKVYIANYADVDWSNLTIDSDGIISSIAMVSTAKFKEYKFRKDTGSMTSTLNNDQTAGTSYVTTEVALVFTKMETAKRIEIAALAEGQLAVIVEDANGKNWMVSTDFYAHASAGSANTGTAVADSNNYSITLSADSKTFPYEVSASAIASVI